jgi:hypothetical protein
MPVTPKQYRELCRLAIAELLGIGVERVRTRVVPNPRRESVRTYRHHIDLWWEIENKVARYVYIAAVLWQKKGQVTEADVLLIEMVKARVGANQAMLITNTEFSKRAVTVANNEGVALLIVQPLVEPGETSPTRRDLILRELQKIAKRRRRLYAHRVIGSGLARALRPDCVVEFRDRTATREGKIRYEPFKLFGGSKTNKWPQMNTDEHG